MNHSSLDPKYTLTGMPREQSPNQLRVYYQPKHGIQTTIQNFKHNILPQTQQYRQINALFVLSFLKTETHHLNRG